MGKVDIILREAQRRWPDIFTDLICETIASSVAAQSLSSLEEQVYYVRERILYVAALCCSSCEECKHHINRYKFAVWADGRPNADIFVIGEGPGQWEQRTLIPFTHIEEYASSRCMLHCTSLDTCYPGQVLALKQQLPNTSCPFVGLSREDAAIRLRKGIAKPNTTAIYFNNAIKNLFTRDSWNASRVVLGKKPVYSKLYITNIAKCRALGKDGSDAPPGIKCANSCGKWLDIQLTIVQPKVVMLVGSYAGSFFHGKDYKVSTMHGKFLTKEEADLTAKLPSSVKYVGYTYHPAYFGREETMRSREEFDEKLRLFWSVFEKSYKVLHRD